MNHDKDLKQFIIDHYEKFSSGEKKVAKYVVDNYTQIAPLSANELAGLINVSDTTVIRFAKNLGFHGYLEFKNKLKVECGATQRPYAFLQKMPHIPKEELLPNYLKFLRKEMDIFSETLDYGAIDGITEELLRADTVYVVGLGSDVGVSRFLSVYLKLLGIKCVPINEEGISLRHTALAFQPNDCVFISCFPITLKDEIWLAEYCKKVGTPLVALTDSEVTANALNCKYFLLAGESVPSFYNSYVIPMALCNMLLLNLNARAPERTEAALKQFKELTNGANL